VEESAVLASLVAWARAAGIDVREVRAGETRDGEPGPRSAACRVRGRHWVVLIRGDSEVERIAAVADALDAAAPGWLDAHWLPPAVRERLESRSRPSGHA
jgi:hypothetical protein